METAYLVATRRGIVWLLLACYPSVTLSGQGGAGGPWCTGNAVYVEDPIWDIACIIYNFTRLA